MSKVVIERVHAHDWKKYRTLKLNALLEEPTAFGTVFEEERNLTDDQWIEKVSRFALSEKQRMYVAKIDDEMVAMMGVLFDERHKRRHIATIVTVYVARAQRSKGIARQLMQAALDNLRSVETINKVKLAVNPNQTSAVNLYKSFGFREVGCMKNEIKLEDHYVDILLMELWLNKHGKTAEPTSKMPTTQDPPLSKGSRWAKFWTALFSPKK